MPRTDRDIRIIRYIRDDCVEVKTAHDDFEKSKAKFMSSTTYRNAVTMPILQIGELVNHLSEEFVETYNRIPWNEMRGIRNLFAHQYHSVDFEIVWSTSFDDIACLESFCEQCLRQQDKAGQRS